MRKATGGVPAARPAIPRGYKLDPDVVLAHVPGGKVYHHATTPAPIPAGAAREGARRARAASDSTGMAATAGGSSWADADGERPRHGHDYGRHGILMSGQSQRTSDGRADQDAGYCKRSRQMGAAMTLAQFKRLRDRDSNTKAINYAQTRLQIGNWAAAPRTLSCIPSGSSAVS